MTIVLRRITLCPVLSLGFAALFALWATSAAASQPSPPQGVPPGAQFHEGGKVWVLEADGRQVVWYQNGLKKAEGEWRNRQREGQWQFWFENGKLKGEGGFAANLREGPWKLYTQNGVLYAAGEYRKNRREGHWKFFYAGGAVESEGPYAGGLRNGEWTSFYDNGQVFYKGQYKNDLAQGTWTYYYKNGEAYQKGQFNNDVRVGEWTICIQPGGPCGKETLRSGQTPRTTRIDLQSIEGKQLPTDTSDPKALLEGLDTGGVPDEVPSAIPNNWQD